MGDARFSAASGLLPGVHDFFVSHGGEEGWPALYQINGSGSPQEVFEKLDHVLQGILETRKRKLLANSKLKVSAPVFTPGTQFPSSSGKQSEQHKSSESDQK